MNLVELLQELVIKGWKFWIEENQLYYDAPSEQLTYELLAQLKQHKVEIIKLLQKKSDTLNVNPLSNNENGIFSTFKLPRIEPALESLGKPFVLNEIQQAYWLGRDTNFELGNVATHLYLEIDYKGLDLNRLNQAVLSLIDRHPMLRSIILADGRQQILAEIPAYKIAITDLSKLDTHEQQQQLEKLREQLSHKILPTNQCPLFKIQATYLGNEKHRLHLNIDALIADTGSFKIIAKQLVELYAEPDQKLSPLKLSFRDYVLAEQALQSTEWYKQSETYWHQRLSSLPPAPELPLAINPSQIKKPRFQGRKYRLTAELWQALKNRGQKIGLTASGILLAAFSEILSLWSRSAHFTLNLPTFNRLPIHPEVNELVGDFTTLTLLEVDFTKQLPFEVRARQLQKQLFKDLNHRQYNGIKLLRELSHRQGNDGKALMPVVFTSTLGLNKKKEIKETYSSILQSGDLVYSISQTPQVWLDHQVGEEEQGALILKWDAVESLFPVGLLDDMFGAYCNFLEQLASNEATWQRSRRDDLLPPLQQQQRIQVNKTAMPVSEALLHSLFIDQLPERASHLAVISPEQSLTYQQLAQLAQAVAIELRKRGAKPNSLIAVAIDKNWRQVVGVLGVLMSGAAYLPLDPKLPPDRLEQIIAQSQVQQIIIADSTNLEIDTLCQLLILDQAISQPPSFSSPLVSVQKTEDLAYVIYTSGSTGIPKGVSINHRGAVNTLIDINRRFNVRSDDRVLALSALNFDLSVYDIFGVLAAGGTIIMPQSTLAKEPAHWLELMQQHQVTLWNSVPALAQMLVDYLSNRQIEIPSGLRLMLLSGDWLPLQLPTQLQDLWPNIEVISLGGATEASIWSIAYPIKTINPEWNSIPYGKPLANQSFAILNDQLEPCPVWTPGELYISGFGLAIDYWLDPQRSDLSFISHPITSERLYKTGDRGRYLPSGNIEFLGRIDNQVKINGFRIELGEIEAVLKQHPIVAQAIVNSDKNELVAYVVPKHDSTDNNGINALRAYQLGDFSETISNPIERTKFKLTQPGLRKNSSSQKVVKLPLLEVDDNKKQDYIKRQSYRQFLSESISLKSFSEFLGCLGQTKINNFPLPKYRYPSAGNLYPVQTYILIRPNGVEDLEPGIYYYHPSEHNLILLNDTKEIDTSIYGSNQPIFEQSTFAIYLISKVNAIAPMYGELSQQFCLLEAGHIGQLLMQNAPEQEIGLCPIGDLEFSSMQEKFALETNQLLLYSFIGGKIDLSKTKQFPIPSKSTQNSKSISVEIKDYLKQKLPTYTIPQKIILLETLPLTSNGKIDRQALLSIDTTDLELETIYIAPRNATEEQLAQIWDEVIQLKKIGIDDNFFDLGGDSLGAIRVVNKIKEIFKIEVPLKNFFEGPTVKTTAEYLDAVTWALKTNQNRNSKKERVEI